MHVFIRLVDALNNHNEINMVMNLGLASQKILR